MTNSTYVLVEAVHRANVDYEIRLDHADGLMHVYVSESGEPISAGAHKIGQTQTLAGARLIRRNHAHKIERTYR